MKTLLLAVAMISATAAHAQDRARRVDEPKLEVPRARITKHTGQKESKSVAQIKAELEEKKKECQGLARRGTLKSVIDRCGDEMMALYDEYNDATGNPSPLNRKKFTDRKANKPARPTDGRERVVDETDSSGAR